MWAIYTLLAISFWTLILIMVFVLIEDSFNTDLKFIINDPLNKETKLWKAVIISFLFNPLFTIVVLIARTYKFIKFKYTIDSVNWVTTLKNWIRS